MAPMVNGQDLALSFLWSCSPRSKAKTRPGHAAKARQLAMLLQRRRHVKQGVPRQCWRESLPAQCAIRPTVKEYVFRGTRRAGGRPIHQRNSRGRSYDTSRPSPPSFDVTSGGKII